MRWLWHSATDQSVRLRLGALNQSSLGPALSFFGGSGVKMLTRQAGGRRVSVLGKCSLLQAGPTRYAVHLQKRLSK